MPGVDFVLRGDHITLDALLKASGLASSGGAAKLLIADGGVSVNGQPESRRGRKLRSGDVVELAGTGQRLCLRPPAGADALSASAAPPDR
jgi:ribosome-associated protein